MFDVALLFQDLLNGRNFFVYTNKFISGQCTLSIPPENIRKFLAF